MARRGQGRIWWLALGVLVCPVLILQARVFLSEGGVNLFDPSSFGSRLYAAVMQVNGGRAEVSVVACDRGVEGVRSAFASLPPGESRYQAGESLGFGVAIKDGRTVRVVTLTPREGGRPLLVSVSQSEAQARASREPVRHQIMGVPVPERASVLSYVRNDDTRTVLERLTARRPREGLVRFYEEAMRRSGWARMFRSAAGDGLLVYVKGADLCCVRVSGEDSDGDSQVTLLHKSGAVE